MRTRPPSRLELHHIKYHGVEFLVFTSAYWGMANGFWGRPASAVAAAVSSEDAEGICWLWKSYDRDGEPLLVALDQREFP